MLMQLQYRLKTRGTRADYSIAFTPFSSVAGQRLQGAAAARNQIKCPGAEVHDSRLVTIAPAIGPPATAIGQPQMRIKFDAKMYQTRRTECT